MLQSERYDAHLKRMRQVGCDWNQAQFSDPVWDDISDAQLDQSASTNSNTELLNLMPLVD